MESPRKYLIKGIMNREPPISVWIQGTIEQAVQNDILIVSDGTGRAKIIKCETADGVIDKKSFSRGNYCCIIGTATKTRGLPEIQAMKFVDLTAQPAMKSSWENEVREADLFLEEKLKAIV